MTGSEDHTQAHTQERSHLPTRRELAHGAYTLAIKSARGGGGVVGVGAARPTKHGRNTYIHTHNHTYTPCETHTHGAYARMNAHTQRPPHTAHAPA